MKTHTHDCQTLADFLELLAPSEDYPAMRYAYAKAFYQGALCLMVLATRHGFDNDAAAADRVIDELLALGLGDVIDSLDARTLQ